MKDKLGKQIFKNSLDFLFLIFFIEIIVKINTNNSLIDWSIARIFVSSSVFAIIFGLITTCKNIKVSKILKTIIASLLTIYSWVEINLYSYMGFFMGVGNAEQGTKIVDYICEYIKSAKLISYLVLIPLIIFILFIWVIRKKLRERKLSKTTYFKYTRESIKSKNLTIILYIILTLLLGMLFYGTLKFKFMQNKLQSTPNIKLIKTNDNSNLNVNQFGLFPYAVSDLIISAFDIEADDEVNNSSEQNVVSINDYSRTINDDIWNEIILEETNNTYNSINKYLISREITPKNEMTGLFEGKNLIVVLMESTNMIAINEKEYPTIYKLWNEGISFRNNYTPRNNCSTGNNEMTVMTSLFTINKTCTANKYKKNVYPEAIFNIFKNEGYFTSSFHDYADAYYSRKTIHPNMGSDHYYNAGNLGIKYSGLYEEWPSDVDLVEKATPYFINEDKFMVFLTSVTTHQPYSVSSEYGDKHLSELSDYDYPKDVKRYMSKMKELDKGLELLLQKLEESGKLDNTVIALFGDHYPYGISKKNLNKVLDYDTNINNEVDRTPMIIYNPSIQKEVYDYTTIIDLLPTLFNLFNVNYDPRLYFGHDIFSEYDHIAIFADGSWQNEKGYFSATQSKFYPVDENNSYTDEEIILINQDINTKQKMSALAIKNDYFNYLNKKTIKYTEMHQTVISDALIESEE